MPFLRFSKDRRGYESTYLLHSSRRRNDKDRPTLLYWFRTPPHVKVGRAAFDETAIRALEDQHPGVEFDWPRILATRPPAEALEPERPRRPSPSRAAPSVPPTAAPAPVFRTPPEEIRRRMEQVEEPADLEVQTPEPIAPPAAAEPSQQIVESPPEPVRKFVRVFDRVTDPEPERPHHLSDLSAVERMLGSEQLGRLRGQYAAALARIGRRITEATLAESLRALAERINPDAWVTEDDVRQGLQGASAVQEELARHVGHRRRRRRRGRPAGAQPGQLATAPSETDSELETGGEEEEDGEVE